MMKWQPIETAPKNPAGTGRGPEILLWTVGYIYQGRWVANEYGGDWRARGSLQGLTCSYWMPLPEPPTEG